MVDESRYVRIRISKITHHRLKTICYKYLPAILQKPRLSLDMCISLILDDLEETISEYLKEEHETKRERKRERAKQKTEYKRYYIPPPP